jgi:D-alanine-D-alanine ligase-like ATP-grasp enzyme
MSPAAAVTTECLTVVRERRRPHPLAWIHRSEAASIAAELRAAGCATRLVELRGAALADLPQGPLLLRLSDPVMCDATAALEAASIAFIGPGAAALARCYDKYETWRIASAAGLDCPATTLASGAEAMAFPLVVKPRRGSDSIGVRLLHTGPLLARLRTDRYIAQERVLGAELTVAVLHGRVGIPLRILLREGAIYSFARKYLWRPGRAVLAEPHLVERVRGFALRVAATLGVDWAARIDLFHEAPTGRLRLLECDAAPLVGAQSAFAASLAAAGMERGEQLRLLLGRS